MKKMEKLFALFFFCAASLLVSSQVTLHTNHLPENYFYNYWYEVDSNSQTMSSMCSYVLSEKVYGKRFLTGKNDSLRIYGVAASLETFIMDSTIVEYDQYWPDGSVVHVVDSSNYYSTLETMCDTSAYDEAYEYFGLYEHVDDSLRLISPQLIVNIKTTPVTYYLDLGTREYPNSSERTRPFPVYEMYFDSVITVLDSFYVGMTSRIFFHEDKCDSAMFYTWPILWRMINPSPGPTSCPDGLAWFNSVPDGSMNRWIFRPNSSYLYYIFPILDTIHTDTTSHQGGTDTVGISGSGLERFVVLYPNPVKSEVRVVSSVGMSQLEFYNMNGEKLMDLSALGFDVMFNVEALPVGCYVVRVHTPLGVASKRLIVSRE